MPRQYTPEELEEVREAEEREAARLRHRAENITSMSAKDGEVKLFDPKKDRWSYGSGSTKLRGPGQHPDLIQFGELVPGVAIVPADHPLLPALLRRRPDITVLEPGEEIGRTYVCEVCDREFQSKRSLANHRKSAHPAPPAPKAAPRPAARSPKAPASAGDDPAHAPESDEGAEE